MSRSQSTTPPPFVISDAPVFDPFEPRRDAAVSAPRAMNHAQAARVARASRLAARLALVGLLGLFALAGAPGWSFVALGGVWLAVEQLT